MEERGGEGLTGGVVICRPMEVTICLAVTALDLPALAAIILPGIIPAETHPVAAVTITPDISLVVILRVLAGTAPPITSR